MGIEWGDAGGKSPGLCRPPTVPHRHPDGLPMPSGAAFGNMAATSSILPNMWSVLAKPTPIFRLLAAKEKHCVANINYIL